MKNDPQAPDTRIDCPSPHLWGEGGAKRRVRGHDTEAPLIRPSGTFSQRGGEKGHHPGLVPLVGSALAGLSIFAGVMFFLLSGCAALNALNIENPRYSIRNIRPRVDIAIPLSASSIDIDFNLEVDNPNSVGLRLDQIDFDLFINDTRVLDSVSEQGVRIPARGIGDVHLRTRIGYQNIRSIWNEVVTIVRGERARYELRGNAYYDTPVGRLRFPVSVISTR